MARLDCKDEAVSATESCLGEAQFQKAYARYVSLCRTTAAAIRLDGPDHVLRAIGAGMSKMLHKTPTRTLRRSTTGSREPRKHARLQAEPTVRVVWTRIYSRRPTVGCGRTAGWCHRRFRRSHVKHDAPSPPDYNMTDTRLVGPIDVETPPGAAAGMRTEPGPAQAARHSASRLGLEAKLDLRARLGLSFLVCTRSNSSQNAAQETALMATVQEMRRQPEQDDRECAAELRSVKEETSSVFTFNLRDDLPVFGDGDSDLDKHLESFQDVCLVVEPKNGREKLQSFARALKGTLRRCYDTIVKEAKLSTMETTRANPRWSLAGRSGHGCFLPRVKRSKGDEGQSLLRWPGKEECAFQDFQASWLEALTELNAAGAYKCQKDLLYDYLHNLRDEASGDRRFWPLRPTPVVKQALEAHHTSTEDAPPQGPKRAKGPTHTTQAQVALPSTGIGEKRKDGPAGRNTLAAQDQDGTGGGTSKGKGKGRGGKGKGGTGTDAQQACRLFAHGCCTYNDNCKFAHVKEGANNQQETAERTLTAKEKKAARNKEAKAQAKAAAGSDKRVYPPFEVAAMLARGLLRTTLRYRSPSPPQSSGSAGLAQKIHNEQKTTASAPSPGYMPRRRPRALGYRACVTLLVTGATRGSMPEWLCNCWAEGFAAQLERETFLSDGTEFRV
ncbi:unnamed protein product, partial [Symbiodinium pilosum]